MSGTNIYDLFREENGQSLEKPIEEVKPRPVVNDGREVLRPKQAEKPLHTRGDKYQTFLDKCDDLERFLDGFDAQDLMYYFREKAKEVGVKYHIANMKRDTGIFKNLLRDYTPREIALMIEFIFFSEQDYLDTERTQPTVLSSRLVNTIYADSKLWAKDEYKPRGVKSVKPLTVKKREWNRKPTKEHAKIGEW